MTGGHCGNPGPVHYRFGQLACTRAVNHRDSEGERDGPWDHDDHLAVNEAGLLLGRWPA